MTGAEALWEALLDRVRTRPPGLSAWRAEAEARLIQRGLPSRKDEDFRRLSPILLETLPNPSVGRQVKESPPVVEGCLALGWGDSGLRAHATLPEGLSVRALHEVLEEEPSLFDSLGELELGDDGFFLANSAGFSEGWVVEVEQNAVIEQPLLLDLCPGSELVRLPRVWIHLGAGSCLSCVEHHRAGQRGSLTSAVTEVTLDPGARLTFTGLVEGAGDDRHFGRCVARVGEQATLQAGWCGGGGRLTRQVVDIRLLGDRASASLSGLLLSGADTTIDQQMKVWHSACDTSSEQVVRAVVAARGHAIMNGSVDVVPGTRRANARQELRGLLLDASAVLDTKPELLIGNDDVVCSHGATVGTLDEEQLFYLRSRGLSGELAKRVLIRSFAEPGLVSLQLPWIRKRALAQIRGLFPETSENAADEVMR